MSWKELTKEEDEIFLLKKNAYVEVDYLGPNT